MVFYEKMGVMNFVFHTMSNKSAFYWRKGLFFYLMDFIFPSFFGSSVVCKKLNFRHVESANDVRRKAYTNAMIYVSQMMHERFFKEGADLFGIDFTPIFKRFIFTEVICTRYQFFELAMRYACEHTREKHVFNLANRLSDMYIERLKEHGSVYRIRCFDNISFILSVISAPLLLWGYWKTKGGKDSVFFDRNIICNTPKITVYEVFKELFGDNPLVRYVISLPYSSRFSKKDLEKVGITDLRLDRAGYIFLRKYVLRYVYVCLRSFSEVSIYGSEMLRLFHNVIVGRAEAPHGENNIFFTAEHFYTRRAVRNEFIRLEKSVSVFFSLTLAIFPKYYFNEVEHNYDFLCSSGRHLEDFYLMNRATTNAILPTGDFDTNRNINLKSVSDARGARLRDFKGRDLAVTVLSCGVVDMSYTIEVKLMDLAKKIARQPGVKVFIRMKDKKMSSSTSMSRSANFYYPIVKDVSTILLTGTDEYELFDFLPVTDLFITNISSSGCDIAMRGGQVMYVDFLDAPDYLLFWEVVKGVRVPGEKAFDEIMNWLKDEDNGPVRAERKKTTELLSKYIGYKFTDFEAYKDNLMNMLKNQVPVFPQIREQMIEA